MGVTVSSNSKISEFSFGTSVLGIIGFAFTLGTFFKVVSVNLTTLGQAEHEVHTYLTNLRTELIEERASLRTMRKEFRRHQRVCRREGHDNFVGMELDEVSLRTMGDVVKHLIKRFRELERPFLEDGSGGIADLPNHRPRARRRNSSPSPPRYTHAAYGSPSEKHPKAKTNHERDQMDDEADDDMYWAQRTKYAKYGLMSRLRWLAKKSEAQYLFETLSRVQIRRIALQVGGVSIAMHIYGIESMNMKETIQRIDDRVNRVVGVRRIDS